MVPPPISSCLHSAHQPKVLKEEEMCGVVVVVDGGVFLVLFGVWDCGLSVESLWLVVFLG